MVGKWTNEPCNGVDEVVNTFWVLTGRFQIGTTTIMEKIRPAATGILGGIFPSGNLQQ